MIRPVIIMTTYEPMVQDKLNTKGTIMEINPLWFLLRISGS